MPNRTLTRIVKKLSNYYYYYGKLVASRAYLLLLFSLSFISYFSLPYITKSLLTVVTPTTHNNIPLSQISTSLDAQCWHASAHVQFNNFTTTTRHPPTRYLITERIRLSHPDQPVTFDLIQQAKAIYESITTTIIVMNEGDSPVSLSSICYKHEGHCLVHAPLFNELKNELDWKLKTNIHNQPKFQYESHPYSIYSNTTFDRSGEFIKADAVLLTFVLKQTQNGNTLRIWNNILQEVKEKHHVVNVVNNQQHASIWYASSNTSSQMIQYKFNLFPYELSYKVQFTMLVYVIIFYLVSMAFSKSNLVKSGYTFGLAAVFLSIACFTTTWGIFIKLGISLNSVPWYLLLLSVNIGSLENVFLLTNAVLYAGCDMIVKEKVSRGLQSVGVPMTITLIAELFILALGTQMDMALIKEFCKFTKVALCVDYVLEMTFVIAILSIDIKRVELTDLDDRQMSKRLHELANRETKNENQQPDFCPVQDTQNKEDSKSCAECKDFKTHRALNALMLCFIVLFLSLFCSNDSNHRPQNRLYQPELNQLSDQFWSTVNPEKGVTWLQIQPPHLLIYNNDATRVSNHVEQLQQLYLAKSMVVRTKIEHRPSLFRMFILSSVQNALVFLLHINVPLLTLCLVTLGIITWMTPKWRDQWLLPLMTHAFNQFFLILMRWFPLHFIKRVYYFYFKGQRYYPEGVSKEYDADSIHHHGAISVQNIFNQQQCRANVKKVQVRTLTHQHVADIQNLDANAKQSLVSCGQDGRIVLWNTNSSKATWMARLDKLSSSRGGVLQATLNPDFFSHAHHHNKKKKAPSSTTSRRSTMQHQQKKKSNHHNSSSNHHHTISLSKNYLSKARFVKVDQGNKWIAAGYDDDIIRVWNVSTGTLVREMESIPHLPSVVEVQHDESNTNNDSLPTTPKLLNRFLHSSSNSLPSLMTNKKKSNTIDRILSIQFMGLVAEYCHPLVAEAAARCRSDLAEATASQNFIVSAHKSGMLHEWDILSGECIQTVKTGHTRDITQLHVVDSKAPHRKLGVTWVFTASKDGTVKCWERRLIMSNNEDEEKQERTRWILAYTIEQGSPATSIATELPVGGMGVLVTGYGDGSVRVWNFETGESVCTLSLGKSLSSTSSAASSVTSSTVVNNSIDNFMVGGPIRKFSKLNVHDSYSSSSSSSSDEDESDTSNSSSRRRHRHTSSDHHGSIYQVVVTRYCEVENGPGLCRGCDTCFGNGFLVASSSMDNKVHAWRLERSDNGHEGSCTLCTKDYHRKQYKHRKSFISTTSTPEDGDIKLTASGRRRRSTHLNPTIMIKKQRPNTRNVFMGDPSTLELLDIEQLAGDAHIPLNPTFLGKVDQPAGRGVVFCDKILAGVRRRRHSSKGANGNGEWETWFASLQYYDPSEEAGTRIPIETFNLDDDQSIQPLKQQKEDEPTQVLKGTLLNLFSGSYDKKQELKYKRITTASTESDDELLLDDMDEDDDTLEASENLPFSAVRHIIPLDGSGLACDFGNFIKLVYLDKMSLTEKERLKQTRDTMDPAATTTRSKKIVQQVVIEEDGVDSGCQCDDDATCSPANKGINGCCGGANKEKNGGKCCSGGSVKKQQKEKRRQKALLKNETLNTSPVNTCGGVRSIADCSLRNNCSRASGCVSSDSVPSINTFSNWL